MIAYDSNEDSLHTGVVRFIWYAADSAHALGQLVAIDYSDSTPDVAFTYDRLGRPLTVTDVLGIRTNVYDALNLLEERHPYGTALVRSYDAYGRASGIALGSDYAVGYGYDEYGRFSTVAVSNGATFTYSYVPNSSLLSSYTNDLGLSVTYAYKPLRDHKTLVSNAWSTNTISTFAYTYDPIGRRTVRIDDGTTTNLFAYNPRSELTSAEMGTNTYSYAYDPIGNRTSSSENGTQTTYAANELNQYTTLNPGATNSTPFTYDADGNMTTDGTWSYTWDAENRLIEVQPLVTNLGSTLVQYMYDAQSRRIARREFTWSDYLGETTWHYVQGRAFRYDDWNLLQELKLATTPRTPPTYIPQTDLALTGIDDSVAAAYVWGLDLSATLQGAGGIGGLLKASRGATNAFSFYDANGNTTEMSDNAGIILDTHAYDGFGKEIDPLANDSGITPFRFSTKVYESFAGASYFGYRFYNSHNGRWLNRDPIHEHGFALHIAAEAMRTSSNHHDYFFVANNAMHRIDPLGLSFTGWVECCRAKCAKPEDVCREGCAARKDKRPKLLGEAICYKGVACACDWSDRYNPPATPEVAECEIVHEKYHLSLQTEPCKCDPAQPQFIKPVTAPHDECGAYKQQLKCLEKISQRDPSWFAMQEHVLQRIEEECQQ